MTKTQEIHADVMAEAKKLLNDIVKPDYVRSDALVFVFRALLARDIAARKECAEIARDKANRRLKAATQSIDPNTQQAQAQFGHQIATTIEATITGGGEDD